MSAPADPGRRALVGYLEVVAAASLWGTWSLFFKPAEAIHPVAPALEVFVVFATVLVVMGPVALRTEVRERPTRAAWLRVLAVGACDTINALCFFAAMQLTTIAVAVLTHYLAPVLIAVAAPIVLGEALRPGTKRAAALSLFGLVLLLEPWREASEASLLGAGLGLASAAFFAANILISKQLGRWFAPVHVLTARLPISLLILLFFIPSGGFALPLAAYGWLLAAALLPGVLAGVLFFDGLARTPASSTSQLMLIEPVVAVLVGFLAFQQRCGAIAAVGAGLILLAAIQVLRAGTAAAVPEPAG